MSRASRLLFRVLHSTGEFIGLWLFLLGLGILSKQLVLPGFQDGLDAFEAGGERCKRELSGRYSADAEENSALPVSTGPYRLVTLLLYHVDGEKEPYHSNGVLVALARPVEKTLAIPLQVGLVVRRHMQPQFYQKVFYYIILFHSPA